MQLLDQLADIGMVRDVRTIQRQLTAVGEPFGIERDGGRPIGYRWKKRAAGLSLMAMSVHERRQPRATLLPHRRQGRLPPAGDTPVKDQTVERDGKTLKITATVADSPLLKGWLQGFGSEVNDVRKKPCVHVPKRSGGTD